VPDKPKIGGSTWTVKSGGANEVRAYDDNAANALADPLAAFDPPDPPDLSYVDVPPEPASEPALRPPMTLEEEIEAAIDFEEPAVPRTVDRVVEQAEAADERGEITRVRAGPPWRVRLKNGVEYAFGDETALRRFALKGNMLKANDLVSSDGGQSWVVAWQLGMGADDFGDLMDFAVTQPTIVSSPQRERVRWARVAGITVVLCTVTGVATQLMQVDATSSSGVFSSPLTSWYDAALGSVLEAPRPHLELPPRPEPVAAPPPPPEDTKELAVRMSTAADHAAVGKDALARGAWEEAAIAYRKALQLDPRNRSYKLGLGIAAEHLLESAKAAQAALDAAPPQ
jgi:hypothetical protein